MLELGVGFREYLYTRARERLLIIQGTKSNEKCRLKERASASSIQESKFK
jgi:hypothetical protein